MLAVGTWLAQYPDVARLVTDHGHELGNHTWSHPTLTGMTTAAVRSEIERCRDRIAALTGGPGAFFRPSAAQHATPEVLRLAGAAGYRTVLSYDVDSRDFTDPGPAAIRGAAAKSRAGSVVSMHLGHPGTLAALPGLLDDLAAPRTHPGHRDCPVPLITEREERPCRRSSARRVGGVLAVSRAAPPPRRPRRPPRPPPRPRSFRR